MKLKKSIAILLSIIVLVSYYNIDIYAFNTVLDNSDNYNINQTSSDCPNNIYNKIHFYLNNEEYDTIDNWNELKKATEDLSNNAQVLNTRTQENNDEEINIIIQFRSDFMKTEEYLSFANERHNLQTIEDLRDFRTRLNNYSKEYHSNLVNQNISKLSLDTNYNINKINYSPFAILMGSVYNLSADELKSWAECDNILNISVNHEETPESDASWADAIEGMNAATIISNQTYTGEGIRIGIYEAEGVCDISNSNLIGKNITLKNSAASTTDHATLVTSIITMIAPNAEYFVSEVDRIGIDWFLDQSCDIINCSFGYTFNRKSGTNSNGKDIYIDGNKQYCYIDKLYDYQIEAHFVTVVVSSGNMSTQNTLPSYNPQNKITTPGYAYNAITVGGVRLVNGNWNYAPGASYVCSTPEVKPNISAPFNVTVPGFGTRSGTSFSAPQVSGCIALLIESNDEYRAFPELILSALSATAQKTNDYTESIGCFDNRVGAGIINLDRMINDNTVESILSSNKLLNTRVFTQDVFLSDGDELYVSCAVLANMFDTYTTYSYNINGILYTIPIYEPHVVDYDIYIYDSSNILINGSILTNSNIELARVNISNTGIYRIEIVLLEDLEQNYPPHWISVSYTH